MMKRERDEKDEKNSIFIVFWNISQGTLNDFIIFLFEGGTFLSYIFSEEEKENWCFKNKKKTASKFCNTRFFLTFKSKLKINKQRKIRKI